VTLLPQIEVGIANGKTTRKPARKLKSPYRLCDVNCDVTRSHRLRFALIRRSHAGTPEMGLNYLDIRVAAYHYVSPPFSLSKLTR